jgi:DNA-binding NarL/FixJ family response regulator
MSKPSKIRIRVQIAESNEITRLGLCALIQKQPSLLLIAISNSFEETLKLSAEHLPDVILYDLQLSQGRHIEQISKLHQCTPLSKILVSTANNGEEIYLDLLRSGASGIVNKNHNSELLLKAIHEVYADQVWISRNITRELLKNLIESQPLKASETCADTNLWNLTPRECSIACLTAKGLSAKKIAETLFLSEKTVRNKLTTIYEKLSVKNQIELCLNSKELQFCNLPEKLLDWDNCPNNKNYHDPF